MAEAKASSPTLRQLLGGVRNQHHPIQRRPNLYDPSVHFHSPSHKTIKASFMSPFARTTKLSATAHSIIKTQLRTHQATIQAKNFVRAFQSSTVKMGVHNLANKKEFESAINDHKVVILDAFATWCGPCKAIAPQVVEFSETYPNAHFVKLDVDEVPDVAQDLGIRAMPTFLIFKDGEKVHEVVGANPKALSAAIEKHHPAKADGA